MLWRDIPLGPLTSLIFPFHIPSELLLIGVTFPSPPKDAPAQSDQSLTPSNGPQTSFLSLSFGGNGLSTCFFQNSQVPDQRW